MEGGRTLITRFTGESLTTRRHPHVETARAASIGSEGLQPFAEWSRLFELCFYCTRMYLRPTTRRVNWRCSSSGIPAGVGAGGSVYFQMTDMAFMSLSPESKRNLGDEYDPSKQGGNGDAAHSCQDTGQESAVSRQRGTDCERP